METSGRKELASLNPGQVVEEQYLLSGKQILTSRTGNPYGALRLSDASAEKEAKLWERAPELLENIEVGQVVKVVAKVQSYQGQTQLVVSQIVPCPDADPSVFMAQGPRSAQQMWLEFDQLLKKINNSHLKKLLKQIFNPDFRLQFGVAPAAKAAHHAYVGGLLEHTVSVGKLALALLDQYPHLDKDLLVTGALLHDIGKVEEFSLGPPIEYTDAGRLEGHIVLGLRLVDQYIAPGFPEPLAAAVRHMMISHHGQEAFGSPQKPKTPEAIVLNMLDDLDAKTQMVQQIMAKARPEASWSNYHHLLERHIYLLDSQGKPHVAYVENEPPAIEQAAELSLFRGLEK